MLLGEESRYVSYIKIFSGLHQWTDLFTICGKELYIRCIFFNEQHTLLEPLTLRNVSQDRNVRVGIAKRRKLQTAQYLPYCRQMRFVNFFDHHLQASNTIMNMHLTILNTCAGS